MTVALEESPWRDAFLAALGEELCEQVSPPVPLEYVSSHECLQVVFRVLGREVDPERLTRISSDNLSDLADAFAAYFECAPPAPAAIALAVERTLRRWPPGSENEGRREWTEFE